MMLLSSDTGTAVFWYALFAVIILGALSLFLWKPKAMSLSCGVTAFLAVSVVISLILLVAVPVLGFLIDAVYWMMLAFIGILWLLFGGRGKTDIHHHHCADGAEEVRKS